MEIKADPVPSDLRFPLQTQSTELHRYETGVPWIYVGLLCGGCILITIAAFHIKEKRKEKDNPFIGFRSKIE
jgi:hypothetical protein